MLSTTVDINILNRYLQYGYNTCSIYIPQWGTYIPQWRTDVPQWRTSVPQWGTENEGGMMT